MSLFQGPLVFTHPTVPFAFHRVFISEDMKGLSDIELLDAYARQRSEDAFRELVQRHIDFIYSAAMRQLRNPHLAEEATQSAFIALAEKAGQLRRQTVIAGWLHRAAHFAALKLQRSEARRKRWEEEAATMNTDAEADVFQELALPHVDGALAELSESDRDAVVLRFLRQLSFRDVAQVLGTSEEAAKKRVSRALEKLRGLLARRGIAISAVALAAGLSQMPVTAAPAALSSALASLAVSTAVPSISIATTILSFMKTTKAKLAFIVGVAILAGSAALLWGYRSGNTVAANPNSSRPSAPKIRLASVMVDDQDKALKFYTETLGFVKKLDIPTGEPGGARWLTVVSPDEPDGTELLLEPMGFRPARTYQKALFDAGIPLVTFAAGNVQQQFQRLKKLGVRFDTEPTATGTATIAVFEDTCGNHIQIFQAAAISNNLTTSTLKIKLNSVMVDDQDKALKFYTEVLGFVKKREIAALRWLTVVSPEDPDGTELLLEPRTFAPAQTYIEALRKAGIPFTQFAVADVQNAYERMAKLGVVFQGKPTRMGPTTIAVFDDTCGNLIQLFQK
jgi:RNA polymerase sigma factor (sigma-70 family)